MNLKQDVPGSRRCQARSHLNAALNASVATIVQVFPYALGRVGRQSMRDRIGILTAWVMVCIDHFGVVGRAVAISILLKGMVRRRWHAVGLAVVFCLFVSGPADVFADIGLVKGRSSVVSWRASGMTLSAVFATGANGRLIQRYRIPFRDDALIDPGINLLDEPEPFPFQRRRWRWTDHGAPPGTAVGSDPSAVVWYERAFTPQGLTMQLRFAVFVRGVNGRLYERSYNNGQWAWIDHGLPPGVVTNVLTSNPIVGAPVAVSYLEFLDVRAIDVFVTTSDARLVQRFFRGRFSLGDWRWRDHGYIGDEQINTLGDSPPSVVVWSENLVQEDESGRPDPSLPDHVKHVEVYITDAHRRFWILSDEFGVAGRVAASGQPWRWVSVPVDLRVGPVETVGTPSAVVGRRGGTQERDVFVRERNGGLVQFHRSIEFRGTWNYVRHPAAITDDRGTPIELASDPLALSQHLVQDGPPEANVFARGTDGSLLELSVTGMEGVWRWRGLPPLKVRDPAIPRTREVDLLAEAPSGTTAVAVGAEHDPAFRGDVFELFSLRRSGILIEAWVDTRDGTLVWRDEVHVPPSAPQVIWNGIASQGTGRGAHRCAETSPVSQLGSIFPQWVAVNPPSLPPPGTHINQGYLTEQPEVLEGVVLSVQVSSIDNPFNHTRLSPENIPQVAHDVNIFVAPDFPYQHLLADANIAEHGATIEVEWELTPDKMTLEAMPAPGDRVWMKGRWIFDCGHPPFKTEIHPPNALAVIRSHLTTTEAVLRLSPFGGPVWYQPADPNISEAQKCPIPPDLKSDLESALWDVALFVGGCERRAPEDLFNAIAPTNMCYFDYNRPVSGFEPPIEFPLPLPPRPSPSAVPFFSTLPGPRGTPASPLAFSTATFVDGGDSPHYVVTLPDASILPNAPDDARFVAGWTNDVEPPRRLFQVCFNILLNQQRDFDKDGNDWIPDWITGLPGIPGVPCLQTDSITEPVIYFAANGAWVQDPGCVLVSLTDHDTLNISAHGYECDLSCREHWDDDFAEAPDDRLGKAFAAFDASHNFGAPPNFGRPQLVHTVAAKGELATEKSRQGGAYVFVFTVQELRVAPPVPGLVAAP
jgi:hypothetical protein